jgi:hypothetical protein
MINTATHTIDEDKIQSRDTVYSLETHSIYMYSVQIFYSCTY